MALELTEKPEEDFFLPNLCEAQSILFLVLVAELLVFVLVLEFVLVLILMLVIVPEVLKKILCILQIFPYCHHKLL